MAGFLNVRSAAVAALQVLLLLAGPLEAFAQSRWTVTVVRASSGTTTICTDQSFTFDLAGQTGTVQKSDICGGTVEFAVGLQSATLRLASTFNFFGCTWTPQGTVAGTGTISGNNISDTTFSGSMTAGGSFFCRSTNPIAVTFRASRQLLTSAPTITAHPLSWSAVRGAEVDFSCAASGNPAPTYKWQRLPAASSVWADLANGGPYSGVTTKTLTVVVPLEGSAVTTDDGFRCVASNSVGSDTSDAGFLEIAEAPEIVTHPQNTTASAGGIAKFSVEATGVPAVTYQWQRLAAGTSTWSDVSNGGGFSGATTATLSVTTTLGMSGDQFRVVVENWVDAIESDAATLTVLPVAPQFTRHPADLSGTVGESAPFTAEASGAPAPTYQWQRSAAGSTVWTTLTDSADYAGTTTATLTVKAPTAAMNQDRFRAVATNSAGSKDSNAATLTLTSAPAFTKQPNDQNIVLGKTAVFTVAATGLPTPTLKWQRQPAGLLVWTDITDNDIYTGSATESLAIWEVTAAMHGDRFRAMAANSVQSVPSNAGTLTVITCSETLGAPTADIWAGGGKDMVTVATSPAELTCTWTAESDVPWIKILSESAAAADGTALATDSGSVRYEVGPNLTRAFRTGTVTIGKQTFTIRQNEASIDAFDPIAGFNHIVNPATSTDGSAHPLVNNRELAARMVAGKRLPMPKGTSADGVSLLLIGVASARGLTFSLTGPGRLEALDGTPSSSFSPAGPEGQEFVVAVYRPPDSYDRIPFDLRIDITDPAAEGAAGSLSFSLVRPPVVMVHGQWDDPTVWTNNGFAASLEAKGFRTFLADYRAFNAGSWDPRQSFHAQVRRVAERTAAALRDAHERGFAATQVDVVSHSMGGLVTRAFIQQPDCDASVNPRLGCFRDRRNLWRGWIRRLITIGTPHFGTPVASVMFEERNTTIAFDRFGRPIPVKFVMAALGRPLELGSVEALRPASTEYEHLSSTCVGKTVRVAGYGIVGDYAGAPLLNLTNMASTRIVEALTGQSIDEVFENRPHDMLVSIESQWGRYTPIDKNRAYFVDTVHSMSYRDWPLTHGTFAEPQHPLIQARVAELLDSTGTELECFPDSPWFRRPEAAADVRVAARTALLLARAGLAADAGVRITAPADGSTVVHATATQLTLTAEPTAGVTLKSVVFTIGTSLTVPAPSAPPFTVTVDLPATLPLGPLSVVVLAEESGGTLLIDSLTLTVSAPDSPTVLAAQPSTLLFDAGQPAQQFLVLGTYDRAGTPVQLDLTASTTGTTYTARNGRVSVTADGLVAPLSTGDDIIDVRHGDLSLAVPVTIECAFTVTPDEHAIAATGGEASVTITTIGSACGWEASTDSDWITLGAESGSGDATLSFSVAKAVDASSRTGTITIAGLLVTVVQDGGVAPQFTTQPSAIAMVVGGKGTFSATATGAPDPTYQWQVSADGTTWTDLAGTATYGGVTSTTLSITGATAALNGSRYRVMATNTAGATASDAATLTVVECTFIATPVEHTVPSSGGSITIDVSAPSMCTWTASSDSTWMAAGNLWEAATGPAASQLGAATGVIGDTLIVASGLDGVSGSPTEVVRLFNASTGAWTDGAPMPIPRYAAAAGVIDGKLYVAGGQASFNRSSLHIYDPATDGWTEGESMPESGSAMAGAVIDGRLYVIGGMSADNLRKVATLRIFDPAAAPGSQWTTGPSMPTERAFAAAAVLDGLLFVIGGTDNSVPFTNAASVAVEAFDPLTNTWVSKAPLRTARFGLAAAVGGGLLYAVGGAEHHQDDVGVSYEALDVVETYDPATGAWTPRSPMPAAHDLAVAGVIGSVIHVVGGRDRGSVASTAHHVLDPPETDGIVKIGAAAVTFVIEAHTGFTSRTGTLTVAGQTVTVVQAGTAIAPEITTQPVSQTAAAGGTVSFSAAATGTPAPALQWQMSTDGAVSWSDVGEGSIYQGVHSATFTIAGIPRDLHGIRFRMLATNDVGSAASDAVTLTVRGSVTAHPTSLRFAGVKTGPSLGSVTSSQRVWVTFSAAPGNWTATADQPWISITESSGTAAGGFHVSVINPDDVLGGHTDLTATITVTAPGMSNSPVQVPVVLTIDQSGSGAAPVGAMETPVDGSTGLSGSIAVTGWAVDDVEVTRVRILRDPVAGEGGGPIFLADAVFVEGARPDVAVTFPSTPRNTRAGWGYLLLTNFLPNQGNGTFRLHAYADDADGNATLLGTKTITVTNSTATRPFGAIDTPGQGETISGTNYLNWGWVLAHGTRRADPPGGGTVRAVIDGKFVGSPVGWTSRSDITALFPGFASIQFAVGRFAFNPSLLTDGVHTIAWVVTDNTGGAEGVGSRYFTVTGSSVTGSSVLGGSVLGAHGESEVVSGLSARSFAEEVALAPADTRPLYGRRGFDEDTPLREIHVDASGRAVIHGEELDRFELDLRTLGPSDPRTLSGYMRVGDHLGPWPIGSRLDETTGVFTWMPGVGFVGTYDLVFLRCGDGSPEGLRYTSGTDDTSTRDGVAQPFRAANCVRQDVRFVLHPKGSNRVGPQVMIDTPSWDTEFAAGEFMRLGGWAIDLDDTVGTGVSTIHSWAYPVTESGHDAPIFLGIAAYGGHRPDVGAIFGDRFARSAYDLQAPPLPPGTYDIAVFAWSTAKHEFVPAKVVRVHVR